MIRRGWISVQQCRIRFNTSGVVVSALFNVVTIEVQVLGQVVSNGKQELLSIPESTANMAWYKEARGALSVTNTRPVRFEGCRNLQALWVRCTQVMRPPVRISYLCAAGRLRYLAKSLRNRLREFGTLGEQSCPTALTS